MGSCVHCMTSYANANIELFEEKSILKAQYEIDKTRGKIVDKRNLSIMRLT